MDLHAGTTRDQPLGRREVAERRLRALADIGHAATSLPVVRRRLRVVEAARTAMGAASASLGVWQPEHRVLRTVLNVGELAEWEEPEPVDEVYPADQATWLSQAPDGHLGLLGAVGRPGTSAGDEEFLTSLGKHSFLSVPVLLGGAWWGELLFTRRSDQPEFDEVDLEWATAVAAQVGAALEAMEHLAAIDRLAHTDALTGLGNRRSVDEWLDDALGQRLATGIDISLVLADVNALKQVNDEQGHDAGDRALVAFARLVERVAARVPGAVTARTGGDEFCIAALGAEPDRVVSAAEELARLAWTELTGGASIGVVNTADPIGPVDAGSRLLRLADAAQYRAKRLRSRHPVVAGRPLPADADGALTQAVPGQPRDRRLLRGAPVDEVHLLEAGLRALDQAATEPVRVRLGLVADLVAHQADAVGWWLSTSEPGGTAVTTVEFAVYRAVPGLAPDELDSEVGASFPLADYPLTARVLDGGACTAAADDPGTDPAERAILDGLGATGLVAAGGPEPGGTRWLVEVFTDANSRPAHTVATVLRVLVLAALHPVRPGE